MITSAKPFRHASLDGVDVYPIGETPKRGKKQSVLVKMQPDAEIPLHSHEGDATMHIVAGSGHVLSDDEFNGRAVQIGDCVFFQKQSLHGFVAGEDGMLFLSQNPGFVDENEKLWDITFDPCNN